MNRIAALALAASIVVLAAAPGHAATKGKWQAWRGSKGPMLFQVGPSHTTQNCFGNCNGIAMRKGTQHTYARTYTTGTSYSDSYYGNEYPAYYGGGWGYPLGGFGGSGFVTPGGVHMGNFSGSGGISGGTGVAK